MMNARRLFAALLLVALCAARPAAAQMRDREAPTPRTWPVVLTQPLDEAGASLLHEVTSLLELLPDQQLRVRRVQPAGVGGNETLVPVAAYREVALALTAVQLSRLRAWQAAHPQQAARLGLGTDAGPN